MSRLILLLFLAGCTEPGEVQQSHEPVVPAVSAGQLDHYPDFESAYVQPRDVYVWTPPGYTTENKHAVVYMHDGQMLFDADLTWNGQEWGADEVASELLASGRVRDFIIVGIDNGAERRHAEYFPEKARALIEDGGGSQAASSETAEVIATHEFLQQELLADEYLKFLVEELKPFVDQRYATDPGPGSTFTLGSSMGGLISMYAVTEYPRVFGGAACISTHWPGIDPDASLPVGDAILTYFERNLPRPGRVRLYFDHGTATLDRHYPPWQQRVDEILRNAGYDADDWQTWVFDDAEHSEDAWRARLHLPLEFLLTQQ